MSYVRLVPLLVAVAAGCDDSSSTKTLVLLATADEHSHVIGFGPGALAKAIGYARDNGGMVPAVSSNIHFSATNTGDDTLEALFDESSAPSSKPLHRSLIVTASNGLRVGFVGIVGADAASKAK